MKTKVIKRGTPRGFASLVITAVVLSIILAGSLALAEVGLVGAKDDTLRTNRLQAKHSANACAEIALLAVRDSGSLSGSISDDPVLCTYSVSDLGGGNYTIHATGTKNVASRAAAVSASFDGTEVTVSNWIVQ